MNARGTVAGTGGFSSDREKRQCPPRFISDLSRPVAAHRLAIAAISLPKKNFGALPRNLK
jgi:hypothetical protein